MNRNNNYILILICNGEKVTAIESSTIPEKGHVFGIYPRSKDIEDHEVQRYMISEIEWVIHTDGPNYMSTFEHINIHVNRYN